MAEHRDIGAFDARAPGISMVARPARSPTAPPGSCWWPPRGRGASSTSAAAPASCCARSLPRKIPDAQRFEGVDAAPNMVAVARDLRSLRDDHGSLVQQPPRCSWNRRRAGASRSSPASLALRAPTRPVSGTFPRWHRAGGRCAAGQRSARL